jgi:hypothetical protein
VSRLAAFLRSLDEADVQLAAAEARLTRAWQTELRRLVRLAIENWRRMQPTTAAAGPPDWHVPNEDEVLHPPSVAPIVAARLRKHMHDAERILTEIGADALVPYGVRSKTARAVLAARGFHITSIVETTRAEVMGHLGDAYEAGESIPKAAARVRSAMAETNLARATMIARTELIGAKNAASVRLASSIDQTSISDDGLVKDDLSGDDPLILFKVWVATGDERTRPTHADADGQTVPLDETFQVGEGELMYPGDESGPPEEVINCRCAVSYTEESALGAGGADVARVKFAVKNITLADGDAPLEPGAAWRSVLCVEGVQTSDMRMLAPGSIEWRELPLTLMAQVETAPGHDGAQVAGRIDTITRTGDEIIGEGVFDTGEYGQEIQRMVGEGTLTGVSIDLAVEEVTFEEPDDYEGEPMDEIDLLFMGVMVVQKGKIMGATITPFPAFEEASIMVAAGQPIRFRTQGYWTDIADDGTRTSTVAAAAGVPIGWDATSGELVLDGITASAAGLAPERPPAAWFEVPEADEPTPLTVTDEGQVYGHAALWGTCHIGLPGCTTPPKSKTGYAYFNLGEITTEEGTRVAVGKITLGTGHADLKLGRKDALAHYDDTGTAVADVTASDGRHGIWLCGAVRPGADAAQVRALQASPVSGDWRPLGGGRGLEMVAALAVNVPGFPVPRQALAASLVGDDGDYETTALVAAGVVTAQRAQEARAAFEELRSRAFYERDMRALRARRAAPAPVD